MFTRFLPGDFSRRSMAANSAVHGRIWSNFKLIQDIIVVLNTCKNKEDPIKNEGARVFTTFYINYSDVQGHITLEFVMVSGRNLNTSKLSCMSSLPAIIKKIQLKMKALDCSQDFSHYKSMRIFQDAEQLTLQSMVGSGRISNSSETLLLFFLPATMKNIRSKM